MITLKEFRAMPPVPMRYPESPVPQVLHRPSGETLAECAGKSSLSIVNRCRSLLIFGSSCSEIPCARADRGLYFPVNSAPSGGPSDRTGEVAGRAARAGGLYFPVNFARRTSGDAPAHRRRGCCTAQIRCKQQRKYNENAGGLRPAPPIGVLNALRSLGKRHEQALCNAA